VRRTPRSVPASSSRRRAPRPRTGRRAGGRPARRGDGSRTLERGRGRPLPPERRCRTRAVGSDRRRGEETLSRPC